MCDITPYAGRGTAKGKRITPIYDKTLKENFDLTKVGQKFDYMQMHLSEYASF